MHGQCFFLKLGGAASCFRSGSKKSRAGAKNSREGCPCPDLHPYKFVGGGFNSPQESLNYIYYATILMKVCSVV